MDQKQVCASVMRCLNRLRLTEAFCDITLLVGDVPIPAHKAVLAGTSKFFHSVLSSDQATDMFQINGMSAPDMVKVLDFLYTGQILVNKNNVPAIETMADQLQIDILSELCSTFRSQQHKKAPPTKKAETKGACRTRTYTRWGRQHTLRPGDSTGDEDSDNDELSLLGEDQDGGYGINMALTGAANCDRVQTEQILLESIRRAHIESPKRKSALKTPRNKPNKRQRTSARGAHKLNTMMMASFPQCKTSLTPESCNMGMHGSQSKANCNLETQSEVCPASALTQEENQMNSAECVTNQGDEVDHTGESSNPMDTIMQEVCKVVDLAGINVYRQHDLTVTSISDTPAGHVLISDTGVEADLGSLLDIQTLLSSYSTSGQPIILTTCDDEDASVTNNTEQTPCCIDLVAEVDQTGDGSPAGVGDEGLCQDLMVGGQPVILTICKGEDEDAAVTNNAEQTPCCVNLVTEVDQTGDDSPSGADQDGLRQDLMLEGQPVILTICKGKDEDAAVANNPEQIPCCVDLVTEVDQTGDGGPSSADQEGLVAGQPVILTTSEDASARNNTAQTTYYVDLVAEVDQTGVDSLSGADQEGLCQDLIVAGQPVILATSNDAAARNNAEQTPCSVDLVAGVGHHSTCQTVEDGPASSADGEGADLMVSSPTPSHISQGSSSSVEAIDNLQPFDMSTISNPAEAEAGFHDYCLITDSVKLVQKSCASESERQVSDKVDVTVETENGESDSKCQVSGSITVVENNDTCQGELEQEEVTLLPKPSQEHSTSSAVASSECQGQPLSIWLKEVITAENSSVDDVIDDGALAGVGSKSTDVNDVSSIPWNDTHVIIIQEPDPESDATKNIQRQTATGGDSGCSTCPWCTTTFTNSVQLRAHTKDTHPDSMYTCTFCRRTFVEEERRDTHMDWCRVGEKVSGRYRCPQCSYSAAKALCVVNHYRVKHTTRCQRTCDRCHQVFNTLHNYYDHQLQVHRENIAETCGRKVYTCGECEFKTVKAYLLKSHMTGHSEQRFSCKRCDKSFKTTLVLKRHEKFIHSSEVLCCSKCDFSSKYVATLKAHEYRTHAIKSAEQSVHHCHYCDYSHVDRSNLSKHERFKHSDERPFLCSFCPTSFKHKHQVTVHERTHTGLRPFQCPLCPYAGRSKLTLKTHHGHHHSDTKPYGCDLCGFHTKAASNLLSHKARCRKQHAAKLKSASVTQRKKFSIALKSQPHVPS